MKNIKITFKDDTEMYSLIKNKMHEVHFNNRKYLDYDWLDIGLNSAMSLSIKETNENDYTMQYDQSKINREIKNLYKTISSALTMETQCFTDIDINEIKMKAKNIAFKNTKDYMIWFSIIHSTQPDEKWISQACDAIYLSAVDQAAQVKFNELSKQFI